MKQKTLLQGVGRSLCILLVIITLNFIITRLVPGDVVISILGETEYYRLLAEYPQKIEETRIKYGLDKSLPEQYLRYLKTLITLDFGYSYVNKQPVTSYVAYHVRWTLALIIPSIILAAIIGGLMGLWAGWRQGGLLDRIATPFFLLLNTIPSNCIAILCLVFFAFKMKWFPISGMTSGGLEGLARQVDILWHMALPLAILTVFRTGSNYIYMKSYTTRVHAQEYIATAVSKGLTDRKVLLRHALRNVLPPFVTMLCMQFGRMLSGSMMIEVVFSWRGMGMLMRNAASSKDFPVLQYGLLLIAISVMISNLLADAVNRRIDPRLREGERL